MCADKGGKTVAMLKESYKSKMGSILGDICRYRRLRKDPTSNLQDKNNRLVEKLFNEKLIDALTRKKLTTKTATAPRIYGLPKIHKEGNLVRPICSSINVPGCGTCKYMFEILKNLTINSDRTLKN